MANNRQQMTVNLAFTADTRAAKAQLADLQRQLSNLVNTPASAFGQGITTNIQEATRAAAELKVHLQNATNVKTGVLDFTKLNQSLQKSDKNLQHYAETLWKIGPQGQQAFMALAESIANAEVPLKRTNAVLDKFMDGLKKTATWQIQSNITHGFQKALSSAYGYAQDLNDSLNNIRIVTGQNIDQMAKFAEQANKAAKALSTTTTNYTDAALIYYQQGLTDEQVVDRTNITVKMANVAGTSAQEVSDQLTAVWNNFYDGSKSLEYYADVMVRLGADTASSSDEISEGLNKFAAVASTVGLSYEYAAAALATVTSETRESADIVGNAYKTLFARIQGLQQGETLDDGTDLNKYSKALEVVGINIFDTTGQLKDMDILLEELGAKWTTLGRAQQTALAQTVGGVRQYTQLIALMDNWDVFQKNLTSAYGATGSLEEQAEIYAESWRAASDRVRAALQGIYDDLINDEAFIDMLDGIEDIITAVDHLIDSFGGLGGVISLIGSLVTKHLHKNLAQELNNIAYTLKMQTKGGQAEIQQKKAGAMNILASVMGERDQLSGAGQTYVKLLDAQQAYIRGQDKVTEGQKEYLEILMDSVKEYYNLAQAANVEYAQSSERAEELRTNIYTKSGRTNQETANIIDNLVNKKSIKAKNLKGVKDIDNLNFADLVESLEAEIGGVKWSTGSGKKKRYKDNFNLKKVFDDFNNKQNRTEEDVEAFYQELDLIIAKALKKTTEKTAKELSKNGEKITTTELEETVNAIADEHIKENIKNDAVRELDEQIGVLQEGIDENIPQVENWADTVVNATQSVSQLSFGIFSLKGAFETLNNTDLSIFERITTALPSLLFGFQSLIVGIKGIADPKLWSSIAGGLDILSSKLVGGTIASTGFWNSTKNLITSLWTWVTKNPAIIAAIVGITLVLGALIAAIDSFKKSTPEAKLEAARNEAAKLAEEADKAAAALTSIKDAVNGYDTVRDKLANCTRGTEEWNEALRANNDYVLDLLDKYPQLASMEGAIISEDGILSITDEALTQVQKQAESEAGMARVASVLGNQAVREAEIGTLISERTNRGMKIDRNTISDYYDDAYLFDEKKYEAYIRKTGGLTLTSDNIGFYQLQEKYVKEQIQQAKDYIEIEKQIQKAKEANEKATKAETEAILASVISYNSKVQDSGYASEITQFASQYNNFEERKDKYLEFSDEDLKNQLLKYYQEEYGNATLEGDTITYGNGQTYDFTRESAINNLAIAEYNTQLDNLVDSLQGVPEEERKLLYALISGDTSGLTSEEFKATQEEGWLNNLISNLLPDVKNKIETAITNLTSNEKGSIEEFEAEALDYDEIGHKERVIGSGTNLAEQYSIDIKTFKEYKKALLQVNEALIDNEDLLNNIAVADLRLQKGIKALEDDWEDLDEVFSDSEATLGDLAIAAGKIQPAIADIANLDENDLVLIDPQFYQDNWSTIQDVFNGIEGSVKELRLALGKEIAIEGLGASEELSNSIIETIDSIPDDIEVGVTVTGNPAGQLAAEYEQMARLTNATVDEINDYFSKLGYDVEYTVKKVPMEIGQEYLSPTYDDNGLVVGYTKKTADAKGEYEMVVPKFISNGKAAGGKITNVGGGSKKSSGGGSSSKPAEKVDRTKKSDVIERYKEINDSIDDMADALDDANKASDRLYGANRLNMMQQQNNIIQNEINLLKEKARQAKDYYDIDKVALEKAAREAGLNFTFDSEGNISNYTSEMEKLFNQLAAAEAKMDTLKTKEAQDKYEESTVKPIQDKIDALKEAIDQYDETRELYEDLENELDDKFYEWQDNNYEQLTYKLEIEVEIADIEQKEIDYYLAKLENDFFKAAEGAVILGTTVEVLNDKQTALAEHIAGLEEQYKKGEISQADFVEGMKKAQEESLDLAKSYLDLQDQMVDYYSNTLAAAGEELAIYTNQMENHNKVLEHYMTLMELTGQETNYKKMASVLQGQVEVAKNTVEVNKAYADILVAEAALRKKELDELDEGSEEWLLARETWLAAEEAAQSALDNMYNATADWIEKEKALIEVEMEGFAKDLEKALTGGVTFDDLNQAMERAQSTQEDYLTTTNKIYETTKLMRTAQDALNETSNSVAKERLKQFINETKQLQEQNKLSNFELEIQQAKYNLLLAEIALEEARNAKSMVRLQRDSEGNFGYVYTADNDTIADAQQRYEDAENDLYNIRLNGAEEFNNKYYQIMQEGYDALRELDKQRLNDATMTEEEYNAKRLEILEHYSNRMKDIQDLYGIATQEDARVIADSWTTEFADLIGEKGIEGWHQATADYFDSVSPRLENWAQVVAEANETIGTSYDDTSEKVKEIVTDNERLLEIILGNEGEDGVIDAIEQEINAVSELATTWAEATDAMMDYIKALEEQAKKAEETVKTHTEEKTQDNLPEQQIPDITTETPSESKPQETKPTPPVLKEGSRVTLKEGTIGRSQASGKGSKWYVPSGYTGIITIDNGGGSHRYHIDGKGWVRKEDIVGYDTGGYTGAWGRMGKLAMLHEKELVLNQADTANFLASMDILHNIIKMIDVQAASSQLGGILSSPGFANNNSTNLEQTVYITASFPYATSVEIEEAFNNLILNQATQFANRRN